MALCIDSIEVQVRGPTPLDLWLDNIDVGCTWKPGPWLCPTCVPMSRALRPGLFARFHLRAAAHERGHADYLIVLHGRDDADQPVTMYAGDWTRVELT